MNPEINSFMRSVTILMIVQLPCPIREVNTQDHFIRKANSSGLDMDVPSCYGSLHTDSLSIHVVLIGTEN